RVMRVPEDRSNSHRLQHRSEAFPAFAPRRGPTPRSFHPFVMYDHDALSAMKLSELKEIAKKLDLKKADTLRKQDLIAKILEEQARAAGKPKPIGPTFVGDEEAIAELATADEVPLVSDPEPEDEDDDDDVVEEEEDDTDEDDDDQE